MNDPIADMLTRIRNAAAIGKTEVVLPMSKIKHGIAKILVETHWLDKVEVVSKPGRKNHGQVFNDLKITCANTRLTQIRLICRCGFLFLT